MPLASGDGRRPARMLTWIDDRIRRGMPRLASRAVRIAMKDFTSTPSRTWTLRRRWSTTVVCQAKVSRPGRFVIVAEEQDRMLGQGQQPPDRPVERSGVAAWKVGPRGAVVGHEDGIADESGVANHIGQVKRGMTRHMEDNGLEVADVETAILEQPVERRSVAGKVGIDLEQVPRAPGSSLSFRCRASLQWRLRS
jgi:hypothetical protein